MGVCRQIRAVHLEAHEVGTLSLSGRPETVDAKRDVCTSIRIRESGCLQGRMAEVQVNSATESTCPSSSQRLVHIRLQILVRAQQESLPAQTHVSHGLPESLHSQFRCGTFPGSLNGETSLIWRMWPICAQIMCYGFISLVFGFHVFLRDSKSPCSDLTRSVLL